MPGTSKGYRSMSLPDLTHKESHSKPVLARLEKLLGVCNFNSQGMSKKIKIAMSRPLTAGPNKGHKGLEVSNLCCFELGLRGVDGFPQTKGLERGFSKLLVDLVTSEDGLIPPLLNLPEHLVHSTIVAVKLSLEVVPLLQSRISFGSSCISFSQSVVPFGSSCISFVSSRIPLSQSVVAFGHGGGKLALQEVKLWDEKT